MYLNIHKDFPFAYSIANEALSVLVKKYNTAISTSEADWLALIFATGLQDIQATQKLNVLVVCQEGRASSQLLKYQIKRNYSKYVGLSPFPCVFCACRQTSTFRLYFIYMLKYKLIHVTKSNRSVTDIPLSVIFSEA